jgi:hypothetical protein
MSELGAAILSEPALVGWLKSNAWRKAFDRGSLSRAVAYANDRSVQVKDVGQVPGDSVSCEASVEGSRARPYQTRVGFFSTGRSWAVEAECSCPVGLYCKHAAAVILLALKELPAPANEPAPRVPVVAKPAAKLDWRLSEWLDGVDKARVSTEKAKKPAPPEKRFLAYCLEALSYYRSEDEWCFSMHVGTLRNDGALEISTNMAQTDLSRPPKYMTREDFVVVSLYHQRKRKENIWSEMKLEKGGWEELLEAAMQTSRLFALAEDGVSWQPVREGPPLHANTAWKILPSGGARPALEFSDGIPRTVLPTQPPRYLDRITGELGLLTGDASPAVLASWMSGPEIPAKQIPLVAERLQRISAALPLPVEIEEIRHPAVLPKPHLVIAKKDFRNSWSARAIIHASLFFRYPGGDPVPPLARGEAPLIHRIRDGKRHVQPRDPQAEQAAGKTLDQIGLFPLPEIYPAYRLDAAAIHAWVFDDDYDEPTEPWFDLLDGPTYAKLRDLGWTMEIHPETGLIIHDAGDFFPAIETGSEHGIEWFRFDAEFEIDGRRTSLIPIIAEAIRRGLPSADTPGLPEYFLFPCADPADGQIRFPARRLLELVDQVRFLFMGQAGEGPPRVDRLGAAVLADSLGVESSETLRSLAALGRRLRDIRALPEVKVPGKLKASLRDYQTEGFRWLQFLADNSLHGILADDMGLGKTVQTLAHLAAEVAKKPGRPSLVVAPTSVVPNWAAEAAKFTPHLKVLVHHGKDRAAFQHLIADSDLVITSYPLLSRDIESLRALDWHAVILDEAQYIKNSKAATAQQVCQLRSSQRLCLSGTPMENHLGELWSLLRFLMPGFLRDEKTFNSVFRRPIEREKSRETQLALNRRVSPLILRRTKDQVASELPPKTELIHAVELSRKQTDLYESVRAAMDKRVRDAIAKQGLAKSHIIVLDALLKLRQICCHPQLLKTPAAQKVEDSAKLDYLTGELLPQLLEEGRRILLFSSFTSMLERIEAHLEKQGIPFLILTGQTKDRATLVKRFQSGEVPIFLISLKAGGTGLNLTAADTVIHYDPWWNPAAENQATDRAHRIGQNKPVFVHKLVCTGTIEERILELQKHKSALVEALLSEETSKLKIDSETLSHLLEPMV